jgi:hypothetical protein
MPSNYFCAMGFMNHFPYLHDEILTQEHAPWRTISNYIKIIIYEIIVVNDLAYFMKKYYGKTNE